MKNNKTALLVELKERLNCSENDCVIINNIVEETSLFGRKNKTKMIHGFMDQLNVSEERADEIDNTFMSILKGRIKWKICHPFKSYDKKKKDD